MGTKYVIAYKYLYLFCLTANLLLLLTDDLYEPPQVYLISVLVLAANIGSWVGYVQGRPTAVGTERILSASRMAFPLLASTVAALGLAAQLSPLSAVVWIPLMNLAKSAGDSLLVVWVACASIFAAELAYFIFVGGAQPAVQADAGALRHLFPRFARRRLP